jgi:hypothetical protein
MPSQNKRNDGRPVMLPVHRRKRKARYIRVTARKWTTSDLIVTVILENAVPVLFLVLLIVAVSLRGLKGGL